MSYKIFALLIILVIGSTFGYLRYEAMGPKGSYFNQTNRYSLGKSDFWRWSLGLDNVGDARGQYFSTDSIVVEVLVARGFEANEEALRKFVLEVERITGKKTILVNVDTFDSKFVNASQLDELSSKYRRHKRYNQGSLFVIYAGDFEGSAEGPAKAFKDFGILVSDKVLKELTAEYRQALREYMAGAMLNQFGLQIGLTEHKNANCIMQSDVQKPGRAVLFNASVLPSAYCDSEIEQAGVIAGMFK
ncbi:MAG: hypothetical protein JNN11_01410 [Candidatus Doudnabacteria bacterium]|nr:hypothetical protein [Candidatus Doudnabacteria bacterium]